MVKLTFPPKTELSRESGADLDFQDILCPLEKELTYGKLLSRRYPPSDSLTDGDYGGEQPVG